MTNDGIDDPIDESAIDDLLEPEDDDQELLGAPEPTGPEDLGDDMTQDDDGTIEDDDDA